MRCVGEERVTCGMLHTVNSDRARNNKKAKKTRKHNNTNINFTENQKIANKTLEGVKSEK